MTGERYWNPYGLVCIDFPDKPSLPVEVELFDGRRADYRAVMTTGKVGDFKLTDYELDWLVGFDDEVAQHEALARALQDGTHG